jgi:hypothetical protein
LRPAFGAVVTATQGRRFELAKQVVAVTDKSFLVLFFSKKTCFLFVCLPCGLLERLHPDWKIIGIRRAAPASCLQSICISLKPPAHEGRFQSG